MKLKLTTSCVITQMRLRNDVTPVYHHSVYGNDSDTGIFISIYFSLFSLHLLQSFTSSFVDAAAFPPFMYLSFALRFSHICFPLDMLRVSQLVTSFQRLCNPQLHSSCSQKPDYFSSLFIVFCLLIFPSFSCTFCPQFLVSSSITESISVLSLWWQWWRLFQLHDDIDNYNDYGMVGEGNDSSNEALYWSV